METQAELEALRRERALLIDKLNNHPDVRKYAGKASLLSGSPWRRSAAACCQDMQPLWLAVIGDGHDNQNSPIHF